MDVKKIKEEFRIKASKNPDNYYATSVLKEAGFVRKNCSNCKRFFWTTTDSNVCGDPACSGGFRFTDNTPAKEKLTYIETWKKFAEHFKKRGYTPINRYPVAARWRDDTDFVQASIYDFQPYVVSGEVEPPANPLVVPQYCLRFNDVDNVGITGAHYTGFAMIGQHAFMPEKDWDQRKYFEDIHSWLSKGLGLPNDEITYHEDAWAGGGNFGPCMEYFSRGLELGNQVYMMYETDGVNHKPLPLKVLDMGMGQERNAWFTGSKPTSYETTFPTVTKFLQESTGIKVDPHLLKKFLPYSSYLNIDEVDDINKTWDMVAKKVGVSTKELQEAILPLAALYSIGEHTRTLLVALTDGVLPSNVGGGYNLRAIYRRAQAFIDHYGWNIDIPDIAEKHAAYLKPQFPELRENLKDVSEVLNVELRKYRETKKRSRGIVKQLMEKEDTITTNKIVELYDSQGITPEQIEEAAKAAKKDVKIPDNFYQLVAERHEKREQQAASKKEAKVNLEGVAGTKALFYDAYEKVEFTSKVIKIIDKYVVLDETYFFATSGGQINDTGTINGEDVVDVFRQGAHIVHVMKNKPAFKEGDVANGKIDWNRRKQLAQHHTLTHIFNGVARKHLGPHAWQSGTAKKVDSARLDMTHYDLLSPEQLKLFEDEANKIIKKDLPVESRFEPRTQAEQKYGFSIYQGGIVPGKELRIVDIKGFDVEACGGTHVHHTGEIEGAKILKATKIQDGVVRLEYVAGNALKNISSGQDELILALSTLLGCEQNQIPGRARELFTKWKQKVKKGKEIDTTLSSTETSSGDILKETAAILKTQPEHLVKTVKRFLQELQ